MIEVESEDAPRPGRPPGREAVLIVGACGLAFAAVLWWSLAPPRRDAGARAAEGSGPGLIAGDRYVGSRACRDCHPGEYAAFTRSGHARTLRPAATQPLARELAGRTVADPERPGSTWTYALDGGRFRVERAEAGAAERFLIDYAFGSGHHATTFVTLTDPNPSKPKAVEHRLTHFAADDSLGITPGQKAGSVHGGKPWGYELTPRETLKCFQCHSTRTSAGGDASLDLATMIPNVSCERCHGPAREHVERARRGEIDLTMPLGAGEWTAEELLTACAACHRDPAKAPPGLIRPENRQLARFQPIGLTQSRCYQESGGALSCVNCHDPHARARSDPARYEGACLECHAAPTKPECPVSPQRGCLDCHMPKIDSGQHILFTDHWIRVREDGQATIPLPAGP